MAANISLADGELFKAGPLFVHLGGWRPILPGHRAVIVTGSSISPEKGDNFRVSTHRKGDVLPLTVVKVQKKETDTLNFLSGMPFWHGSWYVITTTTTQFQWEEYGYGNGYLG
jgi:hypothetical protein